ncbi:MAG: glycosyltransferase [Thiohalomonas sp.]|nr:glycosyltransferase [Thiohalomonas sp.]
MNKLVSVITRTKNRAIFLPRVFETLVKQSYRPLEWIIVNDNGEAIDNLLEELKLQYDEQLDGIEIFLINKKVSTTMEAATNAGLEHAHGFYIKILDDDDTLESTCIEKQVHYMEKEKLPGERGVICYTQNIFEKIENDQIDLIDSSPLALTLENITIADVAIGNQFTIHSFLYETDILKEIGTYNETFTVLGDWEFNLRFIIKFDIGVIPEFLANYHIRTEGIYSNTIVSQKSTHYRYEAVIRNHFMRNEKQYPHIGAMTSNAPSITRLQQKLNTILQTINSKDALIKDKEQQIQTRDILIKAQEEQIKRLSDELTLIYTSKSWRYTGIIRQLRQKLFNKKTNT